LANEIAENEYISGNLSTKVMQNVKHKLANKMWKELYAMIIYKKFLQKLNPGFIHPMTEEDIDNYVLDLKNTFWYTIINNNVFSYDTVIAEQQLLQYIPLKLL